MNDIYFSIQNLLPVVWICLGVALVALIWLLVFYRSRVAEVGRQGTISQEDDATEEKYPDVSVIVYACDNARNLTEILPSLLGQDYPARMEVIVINDGSSDEVEDVVNRLTLDHKNLYLTFIPNQAHNLSRKKLGVSLGVKAARYPYVMLTCAECVIDSDRWLRAMARPFAYGKDVVLGYAHMRNLKGILRRFDEAATGVVWLSAALKGMPYRGTGYNIGYRRSLFFDVKGFSRSLTLHHGDDDIFVSQIATGDNTGVVLTPGSVVAVDDYNPSKAARDLRLRHCFTGRFLPGGTRRWFGVDTFMMWLWLGAVVTGIVFSLPNALPACVFLALVPALWIPLALAWKKCAATLDVRVACWFVPVLMLLRCFRNAWYQLICGRASRRNYTWLQH